MLFGAVPTPSKMNANRNERVSGELSNATLKGEESPGYYRRIDVPETETYNGDVPKQILAMDDVEMRSLNNVNFK